MKLRQAIGMFLESTKQTKAKATLTVYRLMLNSMANFYWLDAGLLDRHPEVALKPSHITTLYTKIGANEKYMMATIKAHQSILRIFVSWMTNNNMISFTVGAKAKLIRIMDHCRPAKIGHALEPFTEEEYKIIREYCKENEPRFYPVVVLAWETGLRCVDMLSLTEDNLIRDQCAIRVVPRKTMHSKPNPVTIPIKRSVMKMLEELAEMNVEGEPILTALFPCNQPFHTEFRRQVLIPCGVYKAFKTMHSFRRSFISRLHNKGVQVSTICSLTGQSPGTVLQYITVDTDTKLDALGFSR